MPCESQREEIGYQRNKQIFKQIYPRDIPSSVLTWSGNPFWQKKLNFSYRYKTVKDGSGNSRPNENPPLFYYKLYTILKEIPISWFKNGCWATCKLEAMRFSVERNVQRLSAEGN